MLAKQSKSFKMESNSDSNTDGPEYTKGLDIVQQIYILQAYMHDKGYNSNNRVMPIVIDELEDLKNCAKTATK